MGVINWLGSKIAKYGLGFKGVTSEDVKIVRKYFPITQMHKLYKMTEEKAYKLYHEAEADDLVRLVEIIEANKDTIMEKFKNSRVELNKGDVDNIIVSLKQIIEAKKAKKGKGEMQDIIDKMLETYKKTNPDWFIEENFREDIVLRF